VLFGKLKTGGTVRIDLKKNRKSGEERLVFTYLSREEEKAAPKKRKPRKKPEKAS